MIAEERMEERYARQVPQAALNLYKLLSQAGIEAYFVGGCVRDLIMGRTPKDWDMCCDAEPEVLCRLFEDNGIAADLKWLMYGTVVVGPEDAPIEISSYNYHADPRIRGTKKALEANMYARDFTMNAMAYDPLHHTLIDAFGGREDIARRIIRTVEPPKVRFARDPFAILRALRLSIELGFRIEENTYCAMEAILPQMNDVPSKRMTKEIGKLIRYSRDKFLFPHENH